MPYIKKEQRKFLDSVIQELASLIQENSDEDSIEGALNYSITEVLCKALIGKDVKYRKVNRAVGVLECVKLELYRRLAAPYEDECIEKNGDIKSYE